MNFGKITFNAMLGFVPDILIAWGYAKLTDGGWQDLWIAILVLQALYLALWLKRAVWAWFVWWVYGKRVIARATEKYFSDNKFPPPEMWVGGLGDYLEQILGDEYERPETKLKAAFEQGTLNGYKLARA
jgi:hypothetical protein